MSVRALEALSRRAEEQSRGAGPAAEGWRGWKSRAASEPLTVLDACVEITTPATAKEQVSFAELIAIGGVAELGPTEVGAPTDYLCVPADALLSEVVAAVRERFR